MFYAFVQAFINFIKCRFTSLVIFDVDKQKQKTLSRPNINLVKKTEYNIIYNSKTKSEKCVSVSILLDGFQFWKPNVMNHHSFAQNCCKLKTLMLTSIKRYVVFD